ncbi:dipeptide ABC transporter ATP-binding protein [Corynebacterium casei]|uniref:dipeptide ABC transporter ATP-binding protein n=1 Tax=Corynebacterium casei TaxID=160386 RepID=UPI0026490DD5|nr:ABC transporter ATP-binding protein [Corynebacterium casei]MDN5840822.1 ABC transporter ATP-binding protein [Corynebacterium casei]MDN6707833.1 ABC transporter ATP-binding protein [Corynebacterium casei]
MSSALLKIDNLAVSYQTRRGDVAAVSGVSLEVHPGEITAIVGESGSGKSTSAMAAIGLLPRNASIDTGEVHFKGRDITNLSGGEWRQLRGQQIALIPQDPNNSLNPVKTIGASVEEAMVIHNYGSAAERKKRAIELLGTVGIDDPERRYAQYPHELSGGMKQRVLIAAALSLEPELIIADEPTSALDVTVQKVILDLLDRMREELGLGILFITHDLAVAGDRADRIVVMEKGQVREEGWAATVLTDPQDDYSKRLLADAPSLAAPTIRREGAAKGSGTREFATEPLVKVSGLTKTYGDFTAVNNVSFEVRPGSTHALVGESGSGKTTTGRMVSLFETPTSGSVTVGGVDILGAKASERKELRSNIQLVYQNPYSSLDPRMRIGDIIAEPYRNFTKVSKSKAQARAKQYLELVALDADMYSRRPRELSGGQRQRVAIARALIVEPELVILDEAVSALDVTVQAQIIRLLDKLQKDLSLTYIFISHDLSVVRQISDTVSVLRRGEQVEHGVTEDVFRHPQSDFTRDLIGAIPGQRYRAGDLNLGL